MLRVEHLEAGYGETTVLRDVTLEVPAQGVLAILGPNGAGKTTLLRAISGLLPARRGRVGLDGKDVSRRSASERVRRGLCHVPDPRGIFPSLTVRDNLVLQAPRGSVDGSIEKAVGMFPRLGERLDQLAGTLSGGEQQMLAVSRAYVQSPKVVLLDEVSMGLAPNIVDEIFAFLERLREEGVALVVVEQFVHRALAIADAVAVIGRGRVVAEGPAAGFTENAIFEAYAGVAPQEATA
ncbi:MAG: ABC transporter ATP-binding protein [Acidimicrobiia bacterium]|nr:ABC transporter ATP-binding protein [Acidimicrobiia bacterium]